MINRFSTNRHLEGNSTSRRQVAKLATYNLPKAAKPEVDDWLKDLSSAERAEALKLMRKYNYA